FLEPCGSGSDRGLPGACRRCREESPADVTGLPPGRKRANKPTRGDSLTPPPGTGRELRFYRYFSFSSELSLATRTPGSSSFLLTLDISPGSTSACELLASYSLSELCHCAMASRILPCLK